MRVVISPDHSVPVVAVNIWYDVGSRDELDGQRGWAHLFEHLMFSGSAHVDSGEHLHLLQSLGGSVNATTWFDRTNYFETVGLGALDLALWLEGDRLATLADHLAEASVETQREVVKEEKRQRYDNVPYGQAMAELAVLVFGADHPYGHTTIGSMADIDAATAASAADFFRAHYRPGNAVITLVGDVQPKDALKRVDRALGWIPTTSRPPRTPATPLPPLTGIPRKTLTDPVPAAASYLAWRLPPRDTPEFDACDLALSILGAGQSARECLTELPRFDSRADAISAYATLHSDPERINRRLAEVEAVDAAQVQLAAATYLAPDSRAQLDYTDGTPDATA